MNDPCIVYEETSDDKNKDLSKEWFGKKIRYFKKDKKSVDFLTRECIVPYIEASELYKSLNASNNNINMITVRDLLTTEDGKSVLKMIIENKPN